jgi:hypothetical protein
MMIGILRLPSIFTKCTSSILGIRWNYPVCNIIYMIRNDMFSDKLWDEPWGLFFMILRIT